MAPQQLSKTRHLHLQSSAKAGALVVTRLCQVGALVVEISTVTAVCAAASLVLAAFCAARLVWLADWSACSGRWKAPEAKWKWRELGLTSTQAMIISMIRTPALSSLAED